MILKFYFTYKTIFLSIHLNAITKNKHASLENIDKKLFLDLRKRYECSPFSLSIETNLDDKED